MAHAYATKTLTSLIEEKKITVEKNDFILNPQFDRKALYIIVSDTINSNKYFLTLNKDLDNEWPDNLKHYLECNKHLAIALFHCLQHEKQSIYIWTAGTVKCTASALKRSFFNFIDDAQGIISRPTIPDILEILYQIFPNFEEEDEIYGCSFSYFILPSLFKKTTAQQAHGEITIEQLKKKFNIID